MTIFDRTKLYASKRGMSLQQVAENAGLGINSIYGWKKKNPSIDRLSKVANVLNVSTDYLRGETDDPSVMVNGQPKEIDIKQGMENKYTVMSYGGRKIPDEELEMIRRILDGGK